MENKPLIFERISAVMADVDPISKARKNEQQGYKFRGIDDMYNELNQHLAKHKVFFASTVLDIKREERATAKGGVLFYTVLTVRWKVYTEDGSFVEVDTVGEAMDSGDKSANKAMSAAYKYALMQLFCIPTEDEKDTEVQTHEVAPRPVHKKVDDAWDGTWRTYRLAFGKHNGKTLEELEATERPYLCWLYAERKAGKGQPDPDLMRALTAWNDELPF